MSFVIFLGFVVTAAIACVLGYAYGIAVTKRILQGQMNDVRENTRNERKKYYQRVLESLHANGTLPPNCDLKMPKASITLYDAKGGVVAQGGRWERLPLDNELLRVKQATGEGNPEAEELIATLSLRIKSEAQMTVPVTRDEYDLYLKFLGEEKIPEGTSALFKGRELVIAESV